jgi:hypothetical protein
MYRILIVEDDISIDKTAADTVSGRQCVVFILHSGILCGIYSAVCDNIQHDCEDILQASEKIEDNIDILFQKY